ncbi:hypothetical protein LBMAG53_35940 [Planctomycetota bacterium]|nr:hypothetical protein LBMAG53_35940 [Planctomycetota bacterium]
MPAAPVPDSAGPRAVGVLAPLLGFADRLGERANPLAVRLVRQRLRSRWFVGTFLILLSLATVAVIAAASLPVTAQTTGRLYGWSALMDITVGRAVLLAVLAVWILASWLAQPIAVGRAVAEERRPDTWDLVALTGLSSRRLAAGVLIAAAVEQVVIAAAMAPFLVLVVLLRGTDPLFAMLLAVLIPLGGVVMSAGQIAQAASIRQKFLNRAATSQVILQALAVFIFAFPGWVALRWTPWDRSVAASFAGGQPSAWIVLAIILYVAFAGILMSWATVSASLSPHGSDRSTLPRTCDWITASCLVLIDLGACYFTRYGGFLSFSPVLIAAIAAKQGLSGSSAPAFLSPRQAKDGEAAPRWGRWWRWIAGPGAVAGRVGFLVMAAVAIGLALLSGPRVPLLEPTWLAIALTAGYLAVADLVVRPNLRLTTPNAQMIQIGTVIALIVLAGTVSFTALALSNDRSANAIVHALNPLLLFTHRMGSDMSNPHPWIDLWGSFGLTTLALQAGLWRQLPVLRPEPQDP